MQWPKIAESWFELIPYARRHWSRLTAYELTVTVGRRDLLLRKLQEAYGLSYDDADHQIERWQRSLAGSSIL